MSSNFNGLDVIVVGGGPAGLSAAMWCDELGLRTLLLEKESETGGQLLRVYNPIENYPGVKVKDGLEMREILFAHSKDRMFLSRLECEVSAIRTDGPAVEPATGEKIEAKAVIIATGVRQRRLDIPGETEFRGKGILESGKRDAHLVKGKHVLIVGGGDAALENALILSEHAEQVFLCHRRDEFAGREEFVEKAGKTANVEILRSHQLIEIAGREAVESVKLQHAGSGEEKVLEVDAVLIRAGVEPNTEFLKGKIEMDERGYIRTNRECETSAKGIYAVGDVSNPISATVATAVGSGAAAAKAIYEYLNPR